MSPQMGIMSEVEQILAGKDAKRRSEIAGHLGDKLDSRLTELEREIAEEIARTLAEDAVLTVRKALAESVRQSRFLPKDVGLKLAYDVEDVAVPFLEATEIFSEEELCDIARRVAQRCKRAIAGRPDLPPTVGWVLSECGDIHVAGELVRNQTAELRTETLINLIRNFDGETTLFEAMAARDVLPPQIVQILLTRVSEAAAAKLRDHYKLSSDYANPLIEEAGLKSMLIAAERANPLDLMALVRDLKDKGKLTPSALLWSLRGGCLKFFSAAMALLAGLSLSETRAVVAAANPEAIQQLCAQAKIPPSLWKEICETLVQSAQANKGPGAAAAGTGSQVRKQSAGS